MACSILVDSCSYFRLAQSIDPLLKTPFCEEGHNASTGENITEAINSDPMKKAIIQIQGVFSELEKSLLVKRLKKARQRKKEETGKCEGSKGWDELDPERKIEVLKLIRRLRRKPRGGGRHKSYQEVCDHLNREGVKTLRGGEWSPQLVRSFHKAGATKAKKSNTQGRGLI